MMVQAREHMPVELVAKIALDIAAALRAAHENTDENGAPMPVVHRDVSPHNVLISERGMVKLTDFGIAKAGYVTSHTPGGNIRGKLNYLAPERILQTVGPMDPRPDVFAASIILYQLLTNMHPFRADSDAALIKSIIDMKVEPAELHRSDLPPSIVGLMARALDPRLERRFATARELAQEVQEALDVLPRPAKPWELSEWLSELVRKAAAQPESTAPRGPITRPPSTGPGSVQTKSANVAVPKADKAGNK
jgi:eukaryotic-like serine/threonine-protein kinase